MGKRYDFERVERDFYKTPPEAIWPLIPHLLPKATFIEPCAGDGRLARFLESQGFKCTLMPDIKPQTPDIYCHDALTLDPIPSHYTITNPPWNRSVLHQMIRTFTEITPTWLLFDSDWMHTNQSIPFLPLLRKIVSIGRVKWFEDSESEGKDNCCWYLFERGPQGAVEFCGRMCGRTEVAETADSLGL